jgi:hypothetical protein
MMIILENFDNQHDNLLHTTELDTMMEEETDIFLTLGPDFFLLIC